MDITLRTLTENDLPFVKDIYDYYTLHTTVVYFVHCASIDELKNYIPVGDPVYRSFIIETPEGAPCGFCYFARFKPREAFRISVELTLYLKPEFTGRGHRCINHARICRCTFTEGGACHIERRTRCSGGESH